MYSSDELAVDANDGQDGNVTLKDWIAEGAKTLEESREVEALLTGVQEVARFKGIDQRGFRTVINCNSAWSNCSLPAAAWPCCSSISTTSSASTTSTATSWGIVCWWKSPSASNP